VSLAPKFVYIPPANDNELTEALGPALLTVADAVVQELDDSTRFNRRRAFTEKAYTELTEAGTVEAGTTWKLAHIFEFGSAKTEPGGHMRNAAEIVANDVGRYEP
jgi:hypothetical protein